MLTPFIINFHSNSFVWVSEDKKTIYVSNAYKIPVNALKFENWIGAVEYGINKLKELVKYSIVFSNSMMDVAR